jgi:hypothetical protein
MGRIAGRKLPSWAGCFTLRYYLCQIVDKSDIYLQIAGLADRQDAANIPKYPPISGIFALNCTRFCPCGIALPVFSMKMAKSYKVILGNC